MVYEIVVNSDYAGTSVKSFLKKNIDVPYHNLFKLIKDKRITLNKKKIKDGVILKEGDIIKVWKDDIKLREKIIVTKRTQDLGLEIIYENSDFLVLNKFPGVVVQGAQDNEKSLSLHLAFLKNKNADNTSFDYMHVHRLDKDTSGVLVCAKNLLASRELNRIFRAREVVKKYVCLCFGEFENLSGSIEVYMKRAYPNSKVKNIVCERADEDSKLSISQYRVVDSFNYDGDIFSLVEVEIKTGLTHQIRVHMKYLGCPIVGDRMYGNSFINTKFENILDRQFLHAKSLEFEFKGKKYTFEAKMPNDLCVVLDKIKK